jgi:hypothetical protein
MTANEIHRHHIATCGRLPIVTVCEKCSKLYWQAWTKEQQAAKKAAK